MNNLTLMNIALLCTIAFSSTVAEATTYWWKIAPNACAVSLQEIDEGNNSFSYGDIEEVDPISGSSSVIFNCPLFIPHGANVNLIRVRTFQAGGLPDDSYISAYLYKRKYDSTYNTVGYAYMDEGESYADSASISETINNENYHYVLRVTLGTTGEYYSGTPPRLGMLEIRYTN